MCLPPEPREYVSEAAGAALANNAPSAGAGVNGSKGLCLLTESTSGCHTAALQRSNSVLIYSPSGSWL